MRDLHDDVRASRQDLVDERARLRRAIGPLT
jgi:hypothetical protein